MIKRQNVKDVYESELNVRKLKVANINIGIYSTSGQNNSDITKQLKNISSLSNVMLMDPNSESVLEDTIKELILCKKDSYCATFSLRVGVFMLLIYLPLRFLITIN